MPNSTGLLSIGNYGAKLWGKRLEVWFNFARDLNRDNKNWYAGSATTVLLDRKEELDPYQGQIDFMYKCHHHEKRCMQIDQLQFYDDKTLEPIGAPMNMLQYPYTLQNQSVTDDLVSIDITSAPFELEYPANTRTRYRLCRSITLHAESDMLAEQLSVEHADMPARAVVPSFSARYYAFIFWRCMPTFSVSPNYFSVGFSDGRWGPSPGYGFTSGVNIQGVNHPLWNDAIFERTDNAFSWTLAPCKSTTCWHLFMRWPHENDTFESRITACWLALKAELSRRRA